MNSSRIRTITSDPHRISGQLPYWEVDPDNSDLHVMHVTAWANSPICRKSQLFSHALLIIGLQNFRILEHPITLI